MAENGTELQRIAWSQVFPFVRLFSTLRLALDFNRLMMALLCIVIVYFGGRILDGIWRAADGGVVVVAGGDGVATEIEVYGAVAQREFDNWINAAAEAREQIAVAALLEAGRADTPGAARELLASDSLASLLVDDTHGQELQWARSLIDDRLRAGLRAIRADSDASSGENEEARRRLINAADTLRLVLTGDTRGADVGSAQRASAVAAIAAAGTPESQAADRERLARLAARQAHLAAYHETLPQGPFISMVDYESRCFAAAIQGVCSGRWGFKGGAMDDEPSLIGSLASAWRGGAWLVIRRPWYTLFYGLFHLLVFAFFGGAICRSAAVQSARDESIGLGAAMGFACEKYGGLLLAPLLPVFIVLAIAIVMMIGSLFGLIPVLGEIFGGLLFILPVLGGFAIGAIILAIVLGFNLMWPTIAVEGSDGFDALSRSCSYVVSRIWHYAFYALVLLVYGALSFVLVRLVVLLTLKLAYKFTSSSMDLLSSAQLTGVGKLSIMWTMPAWADLSLLPRPDGPPLAGTFFNGPMNWAEMIGGFCIAAWVYLFVAMLGAFAVNFFFCGSTQMYFLLRRDVDATDWDELYYEEPEEELFEPGPPDAATETPGEAAPEEPPERGPAAAGPPPSAEPEPPPPPTDDDETPPAGQPPQS